MGLRLKMHKDGLYEGVVSPPHVTASWSTTKPITARKLVAELQVRGCHQQDIGDAMYEQDADWMKKL